MPEPARRRLTAWAEKSGGGAIVRRYLEGTPPVFGPLLTGLAATSAAGAL
jgi:hypothetical protein